jgi:hypothetical protein
MGRAAIQAQPLRLHVGRSSRVAEGRPTLHVSGRASAESRALPEVVTMKKLSLAAALGAVALALFLARSFAPDDVAIAEAAEAMELASPEGAPVPAGPGAAAAFARAPVAAATPAPNSVVAGPESPVDLRLSEPVDPARFDASLFSVFGRWSGVVEGRVTVTDGGHAIRFEPAEPFHSGESVTASLAAGAAMRDGGAMSAGYTWTFWVRPEAGRLDMIDRGERILLDDGEGHAQPYGAYAGDFDGDGYPDIAIPNEVTADVRIMFNDGNGDYNDFRVLDIPGGAWPSPNEGADFNGDGLTDFAVGNAGNDLISVFLADGEGWFELGGNYASGQNVRGVCIVDLNHDGWPDIAGVNMSVGEQGARGNVAILLNEADGTGALRRTASIPSPGNGEKTCATADLNGDGHLDLAVGAQMSAEILLFMGDGEGGLTFSSRHPAGGSPWMVVTGDVDGDGNADVISANSVGDNVAVLLGDGTGSVAAPLTYPTGKRPLAVDVGDLDGDGDLDVVTSDFDGNSFTVHENAGDGTLVSPRTYAASATGSCVVIHDRDLDGDLDLTGVDETDDKIFLWENPGR